jgi:hypothetical protein
MTVIAVERPRAAWLFSPQVDVAVFGGSALLSFALLAIGAQFGVLHSDAPEWAWIAGVLLVDVAHVWSTIFRTYLDPNQLRARPLLYITVPVAAYVIGLALYSLGALTFWRCLAYLAIFHFVVRMGCAVSNQSRGDERALARPARDLCGDAVSALVVARAPAP